MKLCIAEMKSFFEIVQKLGIGEWIKYDPTIVRGLDYYTGIVFEVFAKGSSIKRAIAGGGRYDNLFTTFGEIRPIQAVGFGLGDCVIMELLCELELLPKIERLVDDFILPFNKDMIKDAMSIAQTLRAYGHTVDVCLKHYKKLGMAYTYATKINATRVILIAPTEIAQNKVKVKYLKESKEFMMSIDEIINKK
jgi:histidyl-tRNA synthetase